MTTKHNHLGIPVRSSIYPDWWIKSGGKVSAKRADKIRENIIKQNYSKK